ncbi:MAG: type I methionyl aminopeptidase [Holophagales bacterium]|nr:type I methionyl aminopeptidase [Holophagales bacterium]
MARIILKTPGEIELMHEANAIVHRVLQGLAERVRPGITTRELDHWAEDLIRGAGGVPAFLNYKGFPSTLCTALNDVIVHGMPDDRQLVEGDIVGLDCGVLYKGYVGDAARTYAVGQISDEARRLLRVTRESLMLAAQQCKPTGRLSDIGAAVQQYVEGRGFSVVRRFVGHGVGMSLHEEPQVPNYGRPGKGTRLRPGMVLAIEPMVNGGSPEVQTDPDGWTARTEDGSLSAHFEYSVAITEKGPRILGVGAEESAEVLGFTPTPSSPQVAANA